MIDRRCVVQGWVVLVVSGVIAWAGPDEGDPGQLYRALVAEYESAEAEYRLANQAADTVDKRRALAAKRPDPTPIAREMLLLAEEHPREPFAIDALVWVVRHAGRSPQQSGRSPEAIRAIELVEEQYVRDPRVKAICISLFDSRSGDGDLLRRIAEENPSPATRAEAFLRLAIRERILKKEAVRLRMMLEEDLAGVADLELRDRLVALRKVPSGRFDEESERWLGRVLEEGPGVLEGEEVLNVCTFLSHSVLPNAGEALGRIAERHPDPGTRVLAYWCLADRATLMADWAIQLRWDSAVEADRLREKLGPDSVRVLEAIDPEEQTDEANRFLRMAAQEIVADSIEARPQFWLMLYHIADDVPDRRHLEALEPLIRSILERGSGTDIRSMTERALAAHLVGRAELVARVQPVSEARREAWVEKLGEDRFEALRALDPVALRREAEALLDRPGVESVRLDTISEQLLDRLPVAIGKAGPEIEGEDVNGGAFKLSDYRGKVVLLSFWGMWCGPCREMIAHERALVERFEGRPFAVVGVNNDPDRSELKQYLKDEGVSWRNWWCPGESISPMLDAWKPGGWPTFYLLDPEGTIRGRFEGFTEFETLEAAIEGVLAGGLESS